MKTRPVLLAALCVVQLLLVAVAVWPRLSARLTGDEYRVAVQPVDPIDPFRGAYVRLGYDWSPRFDGSERTLREGDVFVPLVRAGALWKAQPVVTKRPAGPYIACEVTRGQQLQSG